MIAFDGGLLDRAVHPFDLAVGPGMPDLGEAMFDAVLNNAPSNAGTKHLAGAARCLGVETHSWR